MSTCVGWGGGENVLCVCVSVRYQEQSPMCVVMCVENLIAVHEYALFSYSRLKGFSDCCVPFVVCACMLSLYVHACVCVCVGGGDVLVSVCACVCVCVCVCVFLDFLKHLSVWKATVMRIPCTNLRLFSAMFQLPLKCEPVAESLPEDRVQQKS